MPLQGKNRFGLIKLDPEAWVLDENPTKVLSIDDNGDVFISPTQDGYLKTLTVGIGGDYETLEELFSLEPEGKTLINLTDKTYICSDPKFVIKKDWTLRGEGMGKTKITFNFPTAIDPNTSGLHIRHTSKLEDLEVITVNNTNTGGLGQYALHADYPTDAYTAIITRCSFRTVLSPDAVGTPISNGLTIGLGSWEGQTIEFHDCIVEGAYVSFGNKYTLNLHNIYTTPVHLVPSRVSYYNSTLTGGFTTVLISDVYSNDAESNATRVQDLFEFVGCDIDSLWIRSFSQLGTVAKKNGINYNFSGTKVREFLNTDGVVDTSLENYTVKSLPVTEDVQYLRNLGATTINVGDFVCYVYANRLPEYHLTSEKTINTVIGVEKLTASNINNFAGISLVTSLANDYLHFAIGAIAYTSATSATLLVGDNVTFNAAGTLIKSWFGGIGVIRKKTFDNKLGIELFPNGIKTNIIGSENTRGVLEIEGKSLNPIGSSMHPSIRIKDYNGNYVWQQTVGVNSNLGAVEVGRFAISDTIAGLERLAIALTGIFNLTGRSFLFQNYSTDSDPNTSISIGTTTKPGIFRLVPNYNSGDGFKMFQSSTGTVALGATSLLTNLYLTPTLRTGINVEAPIATLQSYQSDAAATTYAGYFSTVRNGLAIAGHATTTQPTDNLLFIGTASNPQLGTGTTLFALLVKGNGNVLINSSSDSGDKLQVTGTGRFTGTVTVATPTATGHAVTKGYADELARPYKVYTAIINQTGTSAPTATVLENTLGGTVAFTYTSVGTYVATLTGAFTADKTICFVHNNPAWSSSPGAPTGISAFRIDNNTVGIRTVSTSPTGMTDGAMINASFEIRVYN